VFRNIEDRHHVFFGCPVSAEVWGKLQLTGVASLSDVEPWNATPIPVWTSSFGLSFYRPFSGGSGMQETVQSSGMKILPVDLLSPKFSMIL